MSSLLRTFNIHVKTCFSLLTIWSLFSLSAILLTTPAGASAPNNGRANPITQREPGTAYGSLPLNFELNQGQTDQRVKFLARSEGYVLFLTATEAVIALDNPATHRKGKENRDARDRNNDFDSSEKRGRPPRSIVRMKLDGANPAPQIEGLQQLMTRSNYFAGADPTAWRTDVSNYARVRYAQVYPGIDMVYYGDQGRLEYDFIVAPGSNPEAIEMVFGGIQDFEINRMGDLVLHTQQGVIRQTKPAAYQEINGVNEEVSVRYIPNGTDRVGFQLGAYD